MVVLIWRERIGAELKAQPIRRLLKTYFWNELRGTDSISMELVFYRLIGITAADHLVPHDFGLV